MTIALPPSGKPGFLALFGRKAPQKSPAPAAKPLGPHDVARLFRKAAHQNAAPSDPPSAFSDAEAKDRDRLAALRRALYAKS